MIDRSASTPRPSAVLIGADSLLCRCGETLLEQGFDVRAVVTGAAKVRDWATARGLVVHDVATDWIGALERAEPFDHLFAITHLAILPERALALPRRGAFNFHDAPLPDLAGLFCPVWGLIEGRREYGVTWHVITAGVDEGDVVASRRFEVAGDETSLSLNTKCFEAGLASFEGLVRRLADGTLVATPQGHGPRRLCRGDERPAAACALDFTRSASELERFVRALDFGPYPNPFGSAWLLAGGAPVWVTRAVAVDVHGGAAPGQVLGLDADGGATVACVEGALRLEGLRRACGSPVTAEAAGLAVGVAVETLSAARADALTFAHRAGARHEEAFVRELAQLVPADLAHPVPHAGAADGHGVLALELPEAFTGVHGDGAAPVLALLGAWLARTSREERLALAYRGRTQAELSRGIEAFVSPAVPLALELTAATTFDELVRSASEREARCARRGTYLVDVVARRPELAARRELAGALRLPVGVDTSGEDVAVGTRLTLQRTSAGWRVRFERAQLAQEYAAAFATALCDFAGELAAAGARPAADVDLVGPALRSALLGKFHAVEHDRSATVASQFRAAVARFADEPALSFEGRTLTFRELDTRVEALAQRLAAAGARTGALVGVHLERGFDLVVAVLAVQRAGAAYLPLDPEYPSERLDLMLSDSGARLVVTNGWRGVRPTGLVELAPQGPAPAAQALLAHALPDDLAYCIYTSGSTGRPKGVLVEHRNAVNFFAGMDERVGATERGTWLAVTSLSFDISVLELLWTLTRGFHVVVHRERQRDRGLAEVGSAAPAPTRQLDFSMFLWGNDDGEGPDKYALTLGAAEFADTHGFAAIWTPERHFHAFGGPFPNPSVVSAAIAVRTSNIAIRAGSCVVPLHHPLRIAEEWAVVDHLSNGRVGLAAASGWQPDDFVLAPGNFEKRGELLYEFVDQVQRLWRGEALPYTNPLGEQVLRQSLPRPVQKELPIWITTAGNPETYRRAGASGANLLTHLLGQSLEEVADKIAIYREARRAAGHDPRTGVVTLMLHTFVGADTDSVRETVRGPLSSYLDASIGLVKKYAWSFPAFKKTSGSGDVDLASLSDEERRAVLDHAFERYFTTSGLFGTVEQCVERVAELEAIGVDEVACLVDYGVERGTMMASFEKLAEVFRRTRVHCSGVCASGTCLSTELWTIPRLVAHHGVTHLQCTPSMARMLTTDPESRAALGRLRHLMVGGEALPVDLARELVSCGVARVTNMYGPTETTVWSSTWDVPAQCVETSIGAPIANTGLFVLDEHLRPLPIGVPGELWIGGEGVVRGYHGRPDLTAERFVPNPFGPGRLYRTGDQAAWNAGLGLRFLGRNDHQVKIRGHRIELGEIEARLREGLGVHDAVAIAREDTPGDVRLVGYVSPTKPGVVNTEALKAHLAAHLPAYMVPPVIVELPSLPLTPNGKVDRKALPRPEELRAREERPSAPPQSELEHALAEVFARLLGLESVGREDNFFELGGHSLLVVQMHRELVSGLAPTLSLTDLYRFPTVARLSAFLGGESGTAADAGSSRGAARGAARRELLAARRRRTAS
jgi:natural product biosynthesis luciferase-like monooxygenase protein